jgi:hypothetical protein
VNKAETAEVEQRLAVLREFRNTLVKWATANVGARIVRSDWGSGKAASTKALGELPALTERILAMREQVRRILIDSSLYHPIVHHHADGTEAQLDVLENLFNEDVFYDVRDFFEDAIGKMEDQLPSWAERFGLEVKDELAQLQAKSALRPEESGAALSNLEDLGERLKKATPEEWEPLAAKARVEIGRLTKRVNELEATAARKQTPSVWKKNAWLAPSMLILFISCALTALAFYIDARTESKLREVGLLVIRDGQNDKRSEPKEQNAQQQPPHAATPPPSLAPSSASSTAP